MNEYWIERSGEQFGPYPQEQIDAMIPAGNLAPTDMISTDRRNWQPIGQTLAWVRQQQRACTAGSAPAPAAGAQGPAMTAAGSAVPLPPIDLATEAQAIPGNPPVAPGTSGSFVLRRGAAALGVFADREIEDFARQGRIGADDWLSPDGRRWIKATALREIAVHIPPHVVAGRDSRRGGFTNRRTVKGSLRSRLPLFFVIGAAAILFMVRLVLAARTGPPVGLLSAVSAAVGAFLGGAVFGGALGLIVAAFVPRERTQCIVCRSPDALAADRSILTGAVLRNRCGNCNHEW